MLHSQKMLKLFELRGRAVATQIFEEGARVGRGFADVGYEEFIVLPGSRILSLLTGEVTSLNDVRREHLFEILAPDALISEIHQAGYRFISLGCPDQRAWCGIVETVEAHERLSIEAPSLEQCLLQLALAVKKITVSPEVRCLKSVMVNV